MNIIGYSQPLNMNGSTTQPLGTVTTGGTSNTIPQWTVVWPIGNRSSQCPHCTPRCPHGYPADQVGPQPWVSPFYFSADPIGWPGSSAHVTANMDGNANSNGRGSGDAWTFTTDGH